MREKSHLDDMRSAIRGDFERLARRRGGQELMKEPGPDPEPEPDPEPASEAPAPESEAEVGDVPRKGFLARLLGRALDLYLWEREQG